MSPADPRLRRARWMLGLVAFGLFVSGVTIFPAIAELKWLAGSGLLDPFPALSGWIRTCLAGLEETGRRSPMLFYAGDWLAFAHIMLAVLFAGAMRDPVRNLWIVDFGLLCCAGILPLALICGPHRGIPPFWTAIDCAFAPAAALPLWIARRALRSRQA